MNERIQQLAKQAGIIGQSENSIAPPMQQFVDLIVTECADWVKSRTMSNELRTELKRHFGIK